MKHLLLSLSIVLLLITGALAFSVSEVAAQTIFDGYVQKGIVPCTGPDCQACHLTQLAQNVIEFGVRIAFIIAALAFAVAGFFYFTAGANEGNVTKAHAVFKNTFIGIVVVLSSWLIVDVLLHVLVGEGVRPFTDIKCVADAWRDPDKSSGSLRTGGGTQSPVQAGTAPAPGSQAGGPQPTEQTLAGAPTLGAASIQTRITNTEKYDSQNCYYAELSGVDNCNATRAIMAVESNGFAQAKNTIAGKDSLGLMQIQPATAKSMDPTLRNLSDEQVKNLLLTNPEKNMEIGNKYYGQLYQRYGDHDLAAAAYNGGAKANEPSVDCPGLHKWQCGWDSPGCYNTGRTDCKRNEGPGSYEETRKYVPNVRAIREKLGQQSS